MKTIEVVAAVIVDSFTDLRSVFATARGYGEYKGMWEFPGGKVEPNESFEEALIREIHEELDTTIEVGSPIETVEFDYPSFHLIMHCYWAKVVEGELVLKEAQEARWLTKDTIASVNWLPADLSLIRTIERQMK